MVLHGHMTLVHLLIHTQLGIIIIPVLLYRITNFALIILEGNHNNKDNNQQHNDSRHVQCQCDVWFVTAFKRHYCNR